MKKLKRIPANKIVFERIITIKKKHILFHEKKITKLHTFAQKEMLIFGKLS
jgi:hypothetical protein